MTPTPPAAWLDAAHPSWRPALAPVLPDLGRIAARLGGGAYLPRPEHVLRALETPLDEVRVAILGQDPYPTPGHAIGRAFAVDGAVRPLPASLRNIAAELRDDLSVDLAGGRLDGWARQGVLLLNRTLTVAPGDAGSHARLGWAPVTEALLRALVARTAAGGAPLPLVGVLWGRQAQAAEALFRPGTTLASAHPSPLSARRGFFGSRPFSRVNALLAAQGGAPIDWAA